MLVFYSSEKDKADFFLTKAWESYLRRIEPDNSISRMTREQKKPWKKPKGFPDPSNVPLDVGIH